MFSTSFLRNILERSINLLCMILFDLDIVFTAIRKYKWISQNTYEKLFGLDHVQVIIVKPTELWKPWQFFFSLYVLNLTENELKNTYCIQSSYWIVNDPNPSIRIKSIVPNINNQKPKKLFVKIAVVISQTFLFFRVCLEKIITLTALSTGFFSEIWFNYPPAFNIFWILILAQNCAGVFSLWDSI